MLTADVISLALLAGLAIPAGAFLAQGEKVYPKWVQSEIRHAIIAFGAGALLSAISFVLVPHALPHLKLHEAAAAFFAGGFAFLILDVILHYVGGSFPQFVAMLADFIPESIALGAMFATDVPAARLLAIIIAAQNLPEGFNAYREVASSGKLSSNVSFFVFTLLIPIGPIAAVVGLRSLADSPEILSRIMLFAAGGILYLMFQDIAPQVPLKKHWWPPLSALGGFFIAIVAHYLLLR